MNAKSPKVILLVIALLLIALYLVFYQIPGSETLSGAAGNSADPNSAGTVYLFQHAYYAGWRYQAYSGEYANLPYPDVSSISITSGTSVRIYSGVNFTGQMACLTGNVAFLGTMGGYNWNDNIRSMMVYSNSSCQPG